MRRGAPREWAAAARFVVSLHVLPAGVGLFFLRARRHARRTGDPFSLASSIRPRELAVLLQLARGRKAVVELGTGTAWCAIALAIGERGRRVITYDPCLRPERDAYLALASPGVRDRIDFRDEPDHRGPRDGETVELLFIDSSHDRDSVLTAFRVWRPSLVPGAVVAFHDYDHPSYPGVSEAIAELGLAGHPHGGLYVWRAPSEPEPELDAHP